MPLSRLSERGRGRLLFLLIALFVGLTFYAISGNRDRAAEGQQAHDALCVLRESAETQLARNEAYLKQKGDPIIIFGLKVPRATIANTVAGQRRTVNSLSRLDC